MNSRVAKTTHKYEIEVPCTIAEALKLDEINDNNLWRDAIQKEMDNVKISFEILSIIKNFHLDIRKPVVILFLMYK